jgi:hypothetical protein
MAKKKEIQTVEVIVIQRFIDKNDGKTLYEAGRKLKLDAARAANVIERGLAKLCEPKAAGDSGESSPPPPSEGSQETKTPEGGLAAAGDKQHPDSDEPSDKQK